jgi:hypothetical protein
MFVRNDTGQTISLSLAGRRRGCGDGSPSPPAVPGETLILQDCTAADIEVMHYDRADGSRCEIDLEDLKRKTRPFKYSEVYFWDRLEEVWLGTVRCREKRPVGRQPPATAP